MSSEATPIKPKPIPPGKPEYFKPEIVAEALKRANGRRTKAARLLGCCAKTVNNYIHRYPELQDLFYEFKQGRFDWAEDVLMDHLGANSLSAAQFILKYGDGAEERGFKPQASARLTTDEGGLKIDLSVKALGLTERDLAAA